MKNWWLETTESRNLKSQLPTAYLVLFGSWSDVRVNLKRRVLNFSFSFVQNQTIYSNSGKLKKFRKQHSGHQNRNAKITSKVPNDATQREDLLWNSLSKKTPNPWVTRTIKRKEDYEASSSDWRNNLMYTTDIVSYSGIHSTWTHGRSSQK